MPFVDSPQGISRTVDDESFLKRFLLFTSRPSSITLLCCTLILHVYQIYTKRRLVVVRSWDAYRPCRTMSQCYRNWSHSLRTAPSTLACLRKVGLLSHSPWGLTVGIATLIAGMQQISSWFMFLHLHWRSIWQMSSTSQKPAPLLTVFEQFLLPLMYPFLTGFSVSWTSLQRHRRSVHHFCVLPRQQPVWESRTYRHRVCVLPCGLYAFKASPMRTFALLRGSIDGKVHDE